MIFHETDHKKWKQLCDDEALLEAILSKWQFLRGVPIAQSDMIIAMKLEVSDAKRKFLERQAKNLLGIWP